MVAASANGHSATFDISQFRTRSVCTRIVFDRPEVNDGLPRPLEMDVRISVTRGEVDRASALLRALLAAETARRADPDSEVLVKREEGARATYFACIAPWVEWWNLQAEHLVDGEWQLADVPPPAEVGPSVFELFPVRAQQWIAPTIQNAWMGDDTISKLARRPDDSASTKDNVTPITKTGDTASSSTSRRSRRPSSK